jgi:predicted nucleic acid-binding protein
MIAPVFVDSNVFIYALLASDARRSQVANDWLERLWEERRGRTSVQALNESYAVLTRKIKPPLPQTKAWEFVQALMSWNPQPVDREIMLRAREVEQRYRLSWWDSLIVAAAQLQNCALLLSEDLQDGAAYGEVTVRNPFQIGVAEGLTRYAVSAAKPPRHPRRGRPRRASIPA